MPAIPRTASVLGPLLTVILVAAGCSEPVPADVGATEQTESVVAPDTATESAADSTLEVPALHPSVDAYALGRVQITGADGRQTIDVRIALTPDERYHGLQEVPSLPDGVGMWFPWDEDRTTGFWMPNMLIPLDIVYVDGDDRVVHVADAVPCTETPCPTYPPATTYRHVLELRAGYMADHGFGIGDEIVQLRP